MFNVFKRLFNPWHKVYKDHQTLAEKNDWPEGLSTYFHHALPKLGTPISQLEFVAIDLETTGLNADIDAILSIGLVPFTLQQIDVAGCREIYINHAHLIKSESAAINYITPNMLKDGLELADAMDLLFAELAGKIPVVHGSCIEKTFFDVFVQQQFPFDSFPCLWLDTLYIEKHFTYKGKTDPLHSFQLNDVRARYALPEYLAHSAAADAFATGELFVVQVKSLFKQQIPCLSKLLAR